MEEKYKDLEVLEFMQIFDIKIDEAQKEITDHGPAAFPLAVYHSVMSRNVLGFTNWHWHDELQFSLVTRGSICFFVNDRKHRLERGQGIFINNGCLHMAKPESDPDSSYLCLNVHPRLLSSFPGSMMESRYMTPYLKISPLEEAVFSPQISWQKEILDGIRAISRFYEKEEFGYELEICGRLNILWAALLRNLKEMTCQRPEGRGSSYAAVQKILTYISRHYSERITLEQIAKELSFSTGECCRMFKRITGETIVSYLILYRISKSTQLLRDTDLSVSQIAYETGFSSTSYFIGKFKAHLGMTPLQFRKKL